MTDVKLDIAFWNYDRTRALSDGKVRIPGVDARYHSGSNVAEIFGAWLPSADSMFRNWA